MTIIDPYRSCLEDHDYVGASARSEKTERYFPNNTITIETTNKCSAVCTMCPRELQTRKLDVMEMGLWKKIVDDALDLGIEYLDLCGFGDVFLDKTIFEKLEYAKKKNPNFKVYVSTTAIGMSKNKWLKTIELVDILKLSIYGRSKDVYEKVMENVNYDIAHRNIMGFLDANAEHNSPTYTIGNFVTMPENEHETQEWINFWEPKLSEIYVWKPHNYLDGRSYRDITGLEQKTCGRPQEGPLNVAVNGDVHVCCFDFNKVMTVGTLKDSSIMEAMNSDKMKYLQERHLKNDFSGLPCEVCDQTVHDDSVLIYKTNPERVVGQSNSSMYVFEGGKN